MASRYETERNIGRRETTARSIPVHDMPDFTAALIAYKAILEELLVPPQDVDKAVDVTIENITTTSHKRRDGNKFLNLVNSLSREIEEGSSQPLMTPKRK